MGFAATKLLWFEEVTCCECGMTFGMESSFYKRKLVEQKTFYCPAGHSQHFTGQTEEDRLKAEKKILEERLLWEQHNVRQKEKALSSAKGQMTKLKNRVKNGVCPCCSRSFVDLHQHMTTQHPDFNEVTL